MYPTPNARRTATRSPSLSLVMALTAVLLAVAPPISGQTIEKHVMTEVEEMRKGGAPATEVAQMLAEKLRQDPAQTTLILRMVGFEGRETGAALSRVYRAPAEEVVRFMKDADYRVEDVAAAAEASGVRSDGVSRVLLDAGYRVTDVARAHQAAGRSADLAMKDLRAADASLVEVTQAVRDVFSVQEEQLTKDLLSEGYTPLEVVEAVAEGGTVTPEAMAEHLMNAGVEFVPAAAAVVEGMLERTVPVAVEFLSRLLGLGGVADLTKDHIQRVIEVLERVGFRVEEVADWLLTTGGASAEAVADALLAVGWKAEDVATYVWGRTTDVTDIAVAWILSHVGDPSEAIVLMASWGWDVSQTLLAFTRDRLVDAKGCIRVAVAGLTDGAGLAVGGAVGDGAVTAVAGARDAVRTCVDMGFDSLEVIWEGVRQGLVTSAEMATELLSHAQVPAREAVAWLLEAGFDPADVWQSVRDILGLTADRIAEFLFAAGLPVDQILNLLTTVANVAYDEALVIIQSLSGGH